VTSTPSPVDSTMLRYCDSRSASADSISRRSCTRAPSSSVGAASKVRNSWTGKAASRGDAAMNGPWPRATFQITRNANPSSAALTPPVPKRTAAHRNSGSGTSSSEVMPWVASGPKTPRPTINSASARSPASRSFPTGAAFTQPAPRVAPITTAGTRMKLVSTFERKRVCQTSRKSCAQPVAVTAAASANDTASGARTANSRKTATPRDPSNGDRPRETRRTASAPSAPSARLLR